MKRDVAKYIFIISPRPSPLCGLFLSPNPPPLITMDNMRYSFQGLAGTFYYLFLLLSVGFVSNLAYAALSPFPCCVFSPYSYAWRDCVNYQTGLNSPSGGWILCLRIGRKPHICGILRICSAVVTSHAEPRCWWVCNTSQSFVVLLWNRAGTGLFGLLS